MKSDRDVLHEVLLDLVGMFEPIRQEQVDIVWRKIATHLTERREAPRGSGFVYAVFVSVCLYAIGYAVALGRGWL